MSNILLIEDNEAIIMGLEYLFTNNGYNVRVARSAYQAKEILDNAKETEKYRTLIGAGDVWRLQYVFIRMSIASYVFRIVYCGLMGRQYVECFVYDGLSDTDRK